MSVVRACAFLSGVQAHTLPDRGGGMNRVLHLPTLSLVIVVSLNPNVLRAESTCSLRISLAVGTVLLDTCVGIVGGDESVLVCWSWVDVEAPRLLF